MGLRSLLLLLHIAAAALRSDAAAFASPTTGGSGFSDLAHPPSSAAGFF